MISNKLTDYDSICYMIRDRLCCNFTVSCNFHVETVNSQEMCCMQNWLVCLRSISLITPNVLALSVY